MKRRRPVQQFLTQYRSVWDNPKIPQHVRTEFEKVIACGTGALGAAIYLSDGGQELEVPFTCKSKICSSCGHKSTLDWVRKMTIELPDVPYSSVLLTMPPALWDLLKSNPELLDSLTAIGSGALQDWAARQYQADVTVIAVLHTFGGDFRFKPHLHILVSRTGLHMSQTHLVQGIRFPIDMIRTNWRRGLINHLRDLHADGLLRSKLSKAGISKELDYQFDQWWKVGVRNVRSNHSYISYLARYLRRPPIANRNILSIENATMVYMGKNTKSGQQERIEMSARDFISRLTAQVANRYANAVHYFGLVAPRAKARDYIIYMALLGQRRAKPVQTMTWRGRLIREFNRDPLIAKDGSVMRWNRNVIPDKS